MTSIAVMCDSTIDINGEEHDHKKVVPARLLASQMQAAGHSWTGARASPDS